MYARLYTGDDGHSHFEDFDPGYEFETARPKSGSTWKFPQEAKGVFFETQPPGYSDDFHLPDARRYHVTLQGQAEIATRSGEKRVFGPGDVCLVEDLTGTGHTLRIVGDEQRSSFCVYVA